MTRASLLYLASFAAHGALAMGIVSMRGARISEDVSVAVIEEAKKPEPKPEPTPPPPPPPDEAAKPVPKAAVKAKAAPPPEAAKVDAPAPASESAGGDAPDFGLALGGATGGPGLAVAAPKAALASPAPAQTTRKVLAAPAPAQDACAEPVKKPKVLTITQPAYTPEAREANVAGRVRVEVTVDATGHVASARVLEGLGHGLDEAALAAARAATFDAATRCGVATTATFVIAIRFAL